MNPERSLGKTPPFSVMFQVQNLPEPQLEFAGLSLRASRAGLNSQLATEIFDLCLVLEPGEAGVEALAVFNAPPFAAGPIERRPARSAVVPPRAPAPPGRSLS